LLFNSFSLYGFSTDPSRKQSPFHANRISAVCDVARVFSPSAPDTIATIDRSIFSTFQGFTGWRTSFLLRQYLHDLPAFIDKTSHYLTFSRILFHKI
jgi:hypothetical protein